MRRRFVCECGMITASAIISYHYAFTANTKKIGFVVPEYICTNPNGVFSLYLSHFVYFIHLNGE